MHEYKVISLLEWRRKMSHEKFLLFKEETMHERYKQHYDIMMERKWHEWFIEFLLFLYSCKVFILYHHNAYWFGGLIVQEVDIDILQSIYGISFLFPSLSHLSHFDCKLFRQTFFFILASLWYELQSCVWV